MRPYPRIGEKLKTYEPREVRRTIVGTYEMRYEIAAGTIVTPLALPRNPRIRVGGVAAVARADVIGEDVGPTDSARLHPTGLRDLRCHRLASLRQVEHSVATEIHSHHDMMRNDRYSHHFMRRIRQCEIGRVRRSATGH
jgi:hypothetical protein